VVQLFKRLGRGRADGLLSPALRRAEGKSHLVASVVVPEEFVDQFQKESGRVGDQRPLESAIMATVQPLLEAHVLTATAELDKTVSFKLHLTFANKKAADEANGPAKDLLAVGRMLLRGITQQVAKERGTEALAALLKEVEIALQAATVESQGEQLQVAVTVKADAAVAATAGRGLFEGVLKVRQASERMQSANNLKQIALAMHNYHATHGHFPPQAITGKDDKPLLSWRVAILPYLEQDNLYRTFRLNEPWDSAHNKALLKQLPPVYAPLGAGKKEPGMTYYQGFTGKHALFDGLKGPRLTEITDGTSNTLLIVEAAEPVPWTKPDDLPFDVKKPLPKLGGLFAEGFQAAFCDGSVRFLPKTIKEATLRALITRDGGEVVEIDK
jgi:hypothetical protein